ncbi:conserved hypothetical protein [Solidesulfovibrio fructosivorans JJ]]|uniref:Uncharacterized protein n=1 Tax=Solidesulfovibrio fructosivorans JJ] TaxID=596151 RepID=E1JZ82_SOLFR|nr:hypothetical protein [Solidesulfovibrio fructosivorans]EFL50365.1 conserved hypothetical protein [Solidesulfovibrio fructosivorans JJ]]
MIDAVDSGGYGVLGLYAAQAPVVPDPPVRAASAATGMNTPQAVAAVPPVQEAAAVGSEPVPAGESSRDGASTPGRDFAGQGQALARQAAVAVSVTASETGSTATTTSASGQTTSDAARNRGLRAYARNGEATASRSAPMLTAQA